MIDILNNDFECKICGDVFERKCDLSRHITSTHDISIMNYCLEYFLDKKHPVCKCGCDKKVKFVNFNYNEYLIGHTGGHRGKYLKGKTYEQIHGTEKSREIKEKISRSSIGRKLSKKHISLIKKNNTGKIRTPETRKKLRLSAIKRIEKNELNNGQLIPNYNPDACEYFNRLMEQTETHIQHAENGGEFYIKELGYWVDGYDKENNIVYEFDEKRHIYNNKKDLQRQNEIEEFLGCEFIRIKENYYGIS